MNVNGLKIMKAVLILGAINKDKQIEVIVEKDSIIEEECSNKTQILKNRKKS